MKTLKRTFLASLVLGTTLHAMPLKEYIQADETYCWQLMHDGDYFQVFDLCSGTWRYDCDVDTTQWHHWLSIIEPTHRTQETALLMIVGGDSTKEMPQEPNRRLRALAEDTGSIVAVLGMVPNQRLTFTKECDERYREVGRREDQIIAYSWDQYLQSGDSSWIAQFPMTRAAVRAMDALEEIKGIQQFVVSGASKRGWTSWLAAASDTRVVGIVPMVIDLLNMPACFAHHQKVYGRWAYPLQDYVDMGIMDRFHSPKMAELIALVDPVCYQEHLQLPKLIINACGDQFFLPDSSQFYFQSLEGPKYLRYIPNTDHSLQRTDAMQTLTAFYVALLQNQPLPEYRWHFDGSTLTVCSEQKPSIIKLWSAYNPDARDFRYETLGACWKSEPALEATTLQAPSSGWKAYFMELTFDRPIGPPLICTTDVFILGS